MANVGRTNVLKRATKVRKKTPWVVCGRNIGTATGWDQVGDFILYLYDFEPRPGSKLPDADISVDFRRGKICSFDDDGKVVVELDLVDTLRDLPIAEEAVS